MRVTVGHQSPNLKVAREHARKNGIRVLIPEDAPPRLGWDVLQLRPGLDFVFLSGILVQVLAAYGVESQ